MRAQVLAVVGIAGCSHGSSAPGQARMAASTRTAIGAYLENPEPYVVASLDRCSFTGPVGKDLRPTATGEITARCQNNVSLRWYAEPATAIRIDGPATIRSAAGALDYIYHVIYVSGDKVLGGQGAITWQTAPDCTGLAELHGYNNATFVIPKAMGRCTLEARDAGGRSAELTITID